MGFEVASRAGDLSDEAFPEDFGIEEECRTASTSGDPRPPLQIQALTADRIVEHRFHAAAQPDSLRGLVLFHPEPAPRTTTDPAPTVSWNS